jgi:hypothetical protein
MTGPCWALNPRADGGFLLANPKGSFLIVKGADLDEVLGLIEKHLDNTGYYGGAE